MEFLYTYNLIVEKFFIKESIPNSFLGGEAVNLKLIKEHYNDSYIFRLILYSPCLLLLGGNGSMRNTLRCLQKLSIQYTH